MPARRTEPGPGETEAEREKREVEHFEKVHVDEEVLRRLRRAMEERCRR